MRLPVAKVFLSLLFVLISGGTDGWRQCGDGADDLCGSGERRGPDCGTGEAELRTMRRRLPRRRRGRQRVDAGFGGAGADDERAGAGAVLRRTGAEEKYSGHDDADLRDDGGDHGAVGTGDLLAGVWRGECVYWRVAQCVSAWGGAGAGSEVCGDDSAADVHGVSADVCDYYAGADYGRVCGADEVFGDAGVHGAVGAVCL